MRRSIYIPLLTVAILLLAGCPKNHQANEDYSAGRKAESLQDYDTALVDYEKALRVNPNDAEYKLRVAHLRFEAAQYHLEQGENALKKGDLQLALAEFQKARGSIPPTPPPIRK